MDITTFTSIEGMDSRDIAKMTGKQHAHVCRDIQSMLEELQIDQSKFGSVYKGGNGEQRRCYILPKRECLILATGYDVVRRAKLVDRWAELESGAAAPIGGRLDPQILQYERRVSFLEGLVEGLRGKGTYSTRTPRTNRHQPEPTYHRKGEGPLPVKIAPRISPKMEAARADILSMPTPVTTGEVFAMLREEHGIQRNRENEMAVAYILKGAGKASRKQYRRDEKRVWAYFRNEAVGE